MTRTARTVSARDLETMVDDGDKIELPGPEGGWATATINGHLYRARVAPTEPDPQDPGRDDTLCAEHRGGKPGAPHEWRRGRRGRTRVVMCNPQGAA